MDAQNVIRLHPHRRTRSARGGGGDAAIAMLVFVAFEAMMFTGMLGAFLLTRAAAGATWPPPGQPWFPLGETGINTAALLLSGALVFQAGRTPVGREARNGPLLLAAVTLGAFFVFFQGVGWVGLIRQGLTLPPGQHPSFFCLIVGLHGATAVAALVFMGIVWGRLVRGSPSSDALPAARILWYFVVGLWPVLYACLYF